MIGHVLKGKYKIEKILGKGAMGEVYLCRNLELGNQWAVKFIPTHGKSVHLMAEVEILKKLDHFSLPHIIDIFEDDSGIYIVESYVEGLVLNKKLEQEGPFEEEMVEQWARNLADGLVCLHTMKPHPIIYRDMKPHNVIITSDNRAVIVDFGISKEHRNNEKDLFIAYTPDYAAPEQVDPEGITDERTDIFSLGVTMFQLLTGKLPKHGIEPIFNTEKKISDEMIRIVLKCIEKHPADRYFSAEELREDLENLKAIRIAKVKLNYKNRIALSLSVVMTILSFAFTYLGLHKLYMDRGAMIQTNQKQMVLTAQRQEPIQLVIMRRYPDGTSEQIPNEEFIWTSDDNNIVSVSAGNVLAKNPGLTKITGKYLDKIVMIEVKVNEPELTGIDVNLKYKQGVFVEKFAGLGIREEMDGKLEKATFLEPVSVTKDATGRLYVVDGTRLRKIENNLISTFKLDYDVSVVRADRKGQIYFSVLPYLTQKEEMKSGIFKIENDSLVEVYSNTEGLSMIMDFDSDSEDNIFVLEAKELGAKSKMMYVETASKRSVLMREIPQQLSGLTVDKEDNVYLVSQESAQVFQWKKGSANLNFFAGKFREHGFTDGVNTRFFAPSKIVAEGEYLYLIDENMTRRIHYKDGKLLDVETLAGQIIKEDLTRDENKDAKIKAELTKKEGIDAVFAAPSDIVMMDKYTMLVADKNHCAVRKLMWSE